MSIESPSQWDCNNMRQGDIIQLKQRSVIYNWYRKNFQKDKIKIKVRTSWKEPAEYKTYYQEDCTLVTREEVACQQDFENEVPCMIFTNDMFNKTRNVIIPKFSVNLNNINFSIDNNTYIIPLSFIKKGIEKNDKKLEQLNQIEMQQQSLKYIRYSGNFFRKRVEEKKLKKWTFEYCNICGKPLSFKFYKDKVLLDNKCTCGNVTAKIQDLSYDDFANWYALSGTNETLKKRYDEFWIEKKEGVDIEDK